MRKIFAAALLFAVLNVSCTKKDAFQGRIKVTGPDGKALSTSVMIPLEGGSSYWNVRSEEDLSIFYTEARQETSSEWFSITDIQQTAPGSYVVNYRAEPRGNTLELRSGTVSMVAPEKYLGAFLCVRQGYERKWNVSFPDGKKLLPGNSWTAEPGTKVNGTKEAWLSFTARTEPSGNRAKMTPLSVSLSYGASFTDINRSTYQVDVPSDDHFGPECYFRLRVGNGGEELSSRVKIVFSTGAESTSTIQLGEVALYEIPVTGNGIIGISESDE